MRSMPRLISKIWLGGGYGELQTRMDRVRSRTEMIMPVSRLRPVQKRSWNVWFRKGYIPNHWHPRLEILMKGHNLGGRERGCLSILACNLFALFAAHQRQLKSSFYGS